MCVCVCFPSCDMLLMNHKHTNTLERVVYVYMLLITSTECFDDDELVQAFPPVRGCVLMRVCLWGVLWCVLWLCLRVLMKRYLRNSATQPNQD